MASSYPKQAMPAGGYAPPPPPPGAAALPMGVVHQFSEDDPRWQCACGMHSRQGCKYVVVAKAVIFVLQMVAATWYYYASIEQQMRHGSVYGNTYNDDDKMIINVVWVIAVLLACALIFVPLALVGLSASGRDKRWMLWPFLCLSACGIMGSVCSLNPLGFLECFFFYVVYQFDQYLKAKEIGVAQPAFVAVATTSVAPPTQQPMYAASPAPAYQPEAPPAYDEAILTKKPIDDE